MIPASGAGGYLDLPQTFPVGTQFPAGAGDYLPVIGYGAGSYLPSEAVLASRVVNDTLFEVLGLRDGQTFTIISARPSYGIIDDIFIVGQQGSMVTTTPMTPGGEYIVVISVGGASVTLTLEVPVDVVNSDGEVVASKQAPRMGILESLTFAIGSVLQSTGGRPSTRTALSGKSDLLFVKSTIGFPRTGYLRIGENTVAYAGKCDTAFKLESPIYVNQGDLVISDVKSIPRRNDA